MNHTEDSYSMLDGWEPGKRPLNTITISQLSPGGVTPKGMSGEQERHLNSLIESFETAARSKYRKGQQEHGGNLWTKRGLIDMAIDEAIDQVIYLLTLKKQIEDAGVQLGTVTE
jgi:hypothetical protein